MVQARGGNYRDKYLRLLDEQERAEKQQKFQMELMRKTLTNLSSAAQGLDHSLDAALISLKEAMRGGGGAKTAEQMERVADAVREFELNRSRENGLAAKHMSSLIQQYQALQIPKPVKESLDQFDASLKKRLSNYRQYPDVLLDLMKLQQMAFQEALKPEEGLWQRIKGGRKLKPEEGAEPNENGRSEQERDVALSEQEFELDVESESLERTQDNSVPKPLKFEAGEEENYQAVAKRIAGILRSLVERIEPNDIVRHKIDIVRLRIDRGMDWYALAVTLEDVRDILFLRYLQADTEFSSYLEHVNEQLESIREALGDNTEENEKRWEAATRFTDEIENRVGEIHSYLDEEKDLDTLKERVKGNIDYIHEALADFKKSQASEVDLTDQLKELIEQVQNIERESIEAKAQLEEERHRATHDNLTGLPNREAFNERGFHELHRHKRYGHPLTLAVCDIDFFKKINDNFGHLAGDKVLKLMAKVMSTRLREVDFVARYGGEEFVILLPETSVETAIKVLDKLRVSIAKTPFRFKDEPVKITISFGLSQFAEGDSVESVFARADKALYKAKEGGRNQCVSADA